MRKILPCGAPTSMVAGPRSRARRVAGRPGSRSVKPRGVSAGFLQEPLRLCACPLESASGTSSSCCSCCSSSSGRSACPEIGRQLGKGMREFKDSVSGKYDDDAVRRGGGAAAGRRRQRQRPRRPRASATASPKTSREMARRIVPRRLSHDEEATLVEHLTELRHRLFICIVAIVPAFAIAYAFHAEAHRPPHGPAPRGGDAGRHSGRRRSRSRRRSR